MVEEFGLNSDALTRLARIVRGADTGRLDLTSSLGACSRRHSAFHGCFAVELSEIVAAMALYDAFYPWCRDASNETHA
jgi:hypothetical protein